MYNVVMDHRDCNILLTFVYYDQNVEFAFIHKAIETDIYNSVQVKVVV